MELEIRDITHRYKNGKMALTHVSLRLTPGIYGLLGPNGAGKSTIMKIITGNLEPTQGSVLLNGRTIDELGRSYRECLGYMPQQQSMYDQFTGRRFLWYMASLKGIPHKTAKERIDSLLVQMNLKGAADRRIRSYSGGMKQRLLIAQAVLNTPQILILDEPTAGLDPKERINIRNFVSELSRESIVIFATHVVSDVECIAKEMILLKDGHIVRMGTPAQLISQLDGLVWKFTVEAQELLSIQKNYLVSSLSVGERGIIVRAVGTDAQIQRKKRAVHAGMEDVYLYYIEGKSQRLKEQSAYEADTV